MASSKTRPEVARAAELPAMARPRQERGGPESVLRLQAAAGNASVAGLLAPALAVQRANLMLGQDPPASASPREIANQVEIREAADAIAQQHGQAPQPFATSYLDAPPTKNWVTGHSNGMAIAGYGDYYDAVGLAAALQARNVVANAEIRLVGCSSGAAPGYLAAETARELAATHNVTDVRIKGAKGILIKTTRKGQGGPSGVYTEVAWAVLNRHLTDAFASLLGSVGTRLTTWFAGLGSEDERFYALGHLEELAGRMNLAKQGALATDAFLYATTDPGNVAYVNGLVNPQFLRIRPQFRTNAVQSMEQRFPLLRDALDRFRTNILMELHLPTKITFDDLYTTYFADVRNRTLQWLRTESVNPLSRVPDGNLTWVVIGGGQFPRIEGAGGHQRRHSFSQ